jgi:hypothetical protein
VLDIGNPRIDDHEFAASARQGRFLQSIPPGQARGDRRGDATFEVLQYRGLRRLSGKASAMMLTTGPDATAQQPAKRIGNHAQLQRDKNACESERNKKGLDTAIPPQESGRGSSRQSM